MNTQQIDEKAVFNAARRIADAAAHDEYLAQACGDDNQAIQRIRELLRIHEQERSFLESPAADLTPTTDLPPIAERPGTLIGPYKLLQQIGEGGMGVVFMAEQTEPIQRNVALKIIKPGMDTRQVIARFEAERQALAMMDHPNIAKVLDAGTTETGRPYFVMELVKGVPITKYCDENKLTLRQRLEIFKPVCEAVQHAHQKGIIHRDLKPTNVLVAEYDNRAVPKVIDFGVAKATAQKLTKRTMFTEFGQVIGTVEYMSPEQAKFNQLDIDTRSDIYSLGVLLYELLSGSTPFERERLREAAFDEVLRIIREEEPPKPSTRLSTSETLPSIAANRHTEPTRLSRDVCGELDWIVMKCLEKDRNRRYETASSLDVDLQRYLSDQPIEASPPSTAYRLKKFIRRNKTAVLAGSAIAVALVAGLILASIGFVQARRQADIAYAEAVRADREADNARTQAKRSEEVSHFLKDMLNGVGPHVALGRDTSLMRDILEKTAQRMQIDLKDQPLVEAELRHTIGTVYTAIGDYAAAEAMHREALNLRQKELEPENELVASSMGLWSLSLWDIGHYAEGERAGRESLALQRKQLGNDDLDVSSSALMLGYFLSLHGKLAEGEALLREALAIRRKIFESDAPELGPPLAWLAGNLWRQDKLAEAESCSREAIRIQRKAFGNFHPDLANSLGELSTVLKLQGRLSEAESARRENLEIRRKLYSNNHKQIMISFRNLDELLQAQGKQSEAEENYREMLSVLRKAVESSAWNPARSNELAWQLATCRYKQMRDPARAIELARQCTHAAPSNGNYWRTLGVARYRTGDYNGAIGALEKSSVLRGDGDAFDWFFLAMAHWQLGHKEEARTFYDKAVKWRDNNKTENEDLVRFQAEAAELLGIAETKPESNSAPPAKKPARAADSNTASSPKTGQ